MIKEIKKFILGKNYDPQENTGKFSGTGSNIENDGLKPSPNGFDPNQNVQNVHPDGGKNTDLDSKTAMKDVQDRYTNLTFELLGQPQTARPMKNAHRDVDAELSAKYYSNMEQR